MRYFLGGYPAHGHLHASPPLTSQLACARIKSEEGRNYLAAMAAAANYAWVNRSTMTFLCRQAFARQFNTTPEELDMHVIYDVSHNIAKMEQHCIDGKMRTLLVHRKGSTRAFPPHHPLIPVDYQVGEPQSRLAHDVCCASFFFLACASLKVPQPPPPPLFTPAHRAAGAHRRHHGHV